MIDPTPHPSASAEPPINFNLFTYCAADAEECDTRWVFPTVKETVVVKVRSSKVAWMLGFYVLLEDPDANRTGTAHCTAAVGFF